MIGLLTGSISLFDWLGSMGTGITGMGELIIITLMAGGMLELIRFNGGVDYIIQKLTKQGKDAAEIYVQQGRQDLADDELAQVKVLETYLPKQMSAEELEAALKEIIAEVGATSGKDMGKVMGVASKKLAGLAEGRAISAKVKELLG